MTKKLHNYWSQLYDSEDLNNYSAMVPSCFLFLVAGDPQTISPLTVPLAPYFWTPQ